MHNPDMSPREPIAEFSSAIQAAKELANSLKGVQVEDLKTLQDALVNGLSKEEIDTLLGLATQLEQLPK
jgi:hypothetical protein